MSKQEREDLIKQLKNPEMRDETSTLPMGKPELTNEMMGKVKGGWWITCICEFD